MAQLTSGDELRDFLRTRRARITPEDAGLPLQTGIRRVPGLRREEVAYLAGISVDYYVRLERGRNLNVSAAVLEAVARVLRLNTTEHDHLFALAKPTRDRPRAMPPQRVRAGLLRALDTVTDVPALILGRRLDVLAANDLARAFYTDFDALAPRDRNMVRLIFLDEAAREFYVDWAACARGIVATLHVYAGSHPHDPRLAELVGELSVHDADFRRWWADHDVFAHEHGTKRYHHPLVGELTLGYEAFHPVGDVDQTFGLHTVEPGSPSANALRMLGSWTAGGAVSQTVEAASVPGNGISPM